MLVGEALHELQRDLLWARARAEAQGGADRTLEAGALALLPRLLGGGERLVTPPPPPPLLLFSLPLTLLYV